MSNTTYINKTKKENKMIRIDEVQSFIYLMGEFVRNLTNGESLITKGMKTLDELKGWMKYGTGREKKKDKKSGIVTSAEIDAQHYNTYFKTLTSFSPLELREELESVSNGLMTLKGTREATNISYAPNETREAYGKLEVEVSKLKNFKASGIEYTMGIYCKKVAKKKEKKDDKK